MKRSLFVWAFFIGTPVVAEKPPTFEDAVSCIKRFEGLHAPEHHPYVGYGHRLLAGETFSNPLTEAKRILFCVRTFAGNVPYSGGSSRTRCS